MRTATWRGRMNEPSGELPQPSNPSRPPRRGGSRRRGGRGRGPRPSIAPAVSPVGISATPEAPALIRAASSSEIISKESPSTEPREQRREPMRRPQLSPIAAAAEQVERIIHTLRESLRELEEVLETLDDAQRQQIGDEKDIEKLRRALSVLQRERQSAEREEPRRRLEERGRNRPDDRARPQTRSGAAESRPPAEPSPEESAE